MTQGLAARASGPTPHSATDFRVSLVTLKIWAPVAAGGSRLHLWARRARERGRWGGAPGRAQEREPVRAVHTSVFLRKGE